MKWSEMSDKDKVGLILKHVIPHDMGDHLVYKDGDIRVPRGKAIPKSYNYPIAAWDELCQGWQTREGPFSNNTWPFDPLHNMNDAWKIVENDKYGTAKLSRYPIGNFVDANHQYLCDLVLDFDNKIHSFGRTPQEAICIAALKAVGVEIES